MAIVRMQKVAIIAHSSLREELLDFLHNEGVIQISEAAQPVKVDHTEVAYREGDVHFAISVLKDVAPKETIAATNKKVDVQTIISTTKRTDVLGIVEELRKLEESDTGAEHDILEAKSLQEILEPWKKLPYDLGIETETDKTIRMIGTLPETELTALEQELRMNVDKSVLEHINTEKGIAYCVIQVWKEEKDFEKFVKTPLGDPANPMDLGMIESKINRIADQNAFSNIASRIVDNVKQIENDYVRRLSNILGHKLDSGSLQKR